MEACREPSTLGPSMDKAAERRKSSKKVKQSSWRARSNTALISHTTFSLCLFWRRGFSLQFMCTLISFLSTGMPDEEHLISMLERLSLELGTRGTRLGRCPFCNCCKKCVARHRSKSKDKVLTKGPGSLSKSSTDLAASSDLRADLKRQHLCDSEPLAGQSGVLQVPWQAPKPGKGGKGPVRSQRLDRFDGKSGQKPLMGRGKPRRRGPSGLEDPRLRLDSLRVVQALHVVPL